MEDFNVPEIRRIDLAAPLLSVHGWGASDARAFHWFEKPPEERLAAAEDLLDMLGALEGGKLTQAGRAMLRVPAHPRLARMLQSAAAKSGRYVAEMQEISDAQAAVGLTPDLFAAYAEVYAGLSTSEAARHAPEEADPEAPLADVLGALDR